MSNARLRVPKRGHFIIVFPPRSGSTLLVSLLNQHENVLCYPEVMIRMSHDDQVSVLKSLKAGEAIEERRANPRIWGICRGTEAKKSYFSGKSPFPAIDYVGFKTKLGQIDDQARFRAAVEENEFRIIHMSRRNIVATAVSALNQKRLRSKFSNSNARSAKQVQGPLRVKKAEFHQLIHAREQLNQRMDDYLGSFNVPMHKFYYENLLADRTRFMDELFGFLEVPHVPVEYSDFTFKNTPKKLEQAILNYDQIRNRYKGTRFEEFFVDA